MAELEKKLSISESSLKSLRKDHAALQKEMERVKCQLAESTTQSRKATEELRKLRIRHRHLEQQLSDAQKSLAKENVLSADGTPPLGNVPAEPTSANNLSKSELWTVEKKYQKRVTDMQSKINRLTQELEQITEKERKLRTLLQRPVHSSIQDLLALETRVHELHQSQQTLEQENEQLKWSLQQENPELQALRTVNAQLQHTLDQVRAEMQVDREDGNEIQSDRLRKSMQRVSILEKERLDRERQVMTLKFREEELMLQLRFAQQQQQQSSTQVCRSSVFSCILCILSIFSRSLLVFPDLMRLIRVHPK